MPLLVSTSRLSLRLPHHIQLQAVLGGAPCCLCCELRQPAHSGTAVCRVRSSCRARSSASKLTAQHRAVSRHPRRAQWLCRGQTPPEPRGALRTPQPGNCLQPLAISETICQSLRNMLRCRLPNRVVERFHSSVTAQSRCARLATCMIFRAQMHGHKENPRCAVL